MLFKRWVSRAVWAAVAAVGVQSMAMAQDFPSHSVKMLVPNSAGSAPDLLARQVGQLLTQKWGQSVVVENKGASGGVQAVDAIAKSPADGHHLLVGGDGALAIMPHLQPNLPYDVQKDVVPVVKLGQVEYVLVANPKTGFKTLQDLVQAAKAKPGQINFASAGTGSALHLTMELLKQRAGFYATHIPYRGGPLGMQDVLAGQVDVMFIALAPSLPHIRSGKLVALATSGPKRNALLPDVPAVAESYAGYQSVTWFGLFAPKGTPADVIQKIERDATAVLTDGALRQQLARQGIATTGEGQQVFAQQVRGDYQRYAQLISHIGLKLE